MTSYRLASLLLPHDLPSSSKEGYDYHSFKNASISFPTSNQRQGGRLTFIVSFFMLYRWPIRKIHTKTVIFCSMVSKSLETGWPVGLPRRRKNRIFLQKRFFVDIHPWMKFLQQLRIFQANPGPLTPFLGYQTTFKVKLILTCKFLYN